MSNRGLKQTTEEELLRLVKSDSYEAFEELYNRHWHSLYGRAYNILKDHNNSKDIVQDIFIWFWEHRNQWNLNNCKGYLLTAVRFKTLNYIRANKARSEFYSGIDQVELSVINQETMLEVAQLEALIKDIVSELPPKCYEVFSLSRFQYLSNKEIATRLDISEKTVEGHITAALKKLRQKLGNGNLLLYLFA